MYFLLLLCLHYAQLVVFKQIYSLFSFKIIQLTQMSELVRKGIVQASEDLQRENDEAVWQEGVLRHVPIVGSLYNWINPLQKVKYTFK